MSESEKEIMKEQEITILEHLDELRKRILICLFFVTVFTIAAYIKSSWIMSFLKQPLGNILLIFTSPVEGFMTKLKVALLGGLILASPVLLLQTMLFIAPGLYKKEKVLLFSTLPFIILLFFGGVAFCYYFIMPQTLSFLMGFGNEFMTPMLSVEKYYSFVMMFALAMGLVFELPLAMLLLSTLGIVNYKFLAKKRKYAILTIVITTAVITPTPDAITLIAVSIPLLVLFELSLILVYIAERIRKKKKKDEIETDWEEDEFDDGEVLHEDS